MLIGLQDRLVRLLTWRRARAYALVLVVLYVVAWADVLYYGSPPLNSGGVPIAGDYIAFHAAGRLVLTGHAAQMYDHSAISAVQVEFLGGRIPNFYDAFRNPPFYALIYAPLAALDLLPGFVIWTLLSLACLGVSIRLLVDEVPQLRSRWRGLLIFVLAFPPVYFGLIDGENAMVSLVLYALIYRSLVRGQDGSAGAWAALGLFKPQLFFVFPLIFVASRRWRALIAYVAVACVLLAVSFPMVGIDGLLAWTRVILEPESGNATVNGWRMASLKSFFDALLPTTSGVSIALYAAVSVPLLFVLLRAWSRPVTSLSSVWALSVLVATLVDPHLVDYDLTVLVTAGVIGAALVPRLGWLIVPLYLVTLLRAQIPFGDLSLQLTAPLLACCALMLLRETPAPGASAGSGVQLAGARANGSGLLPSRSHR
jgi:alpha-1,2-mannosyltransferase